MSPNGLMIKSCNIRVLSVEAKIAHGSEAVVLRVGSLCISLINIKVNLVGPFILHFISPIEASLVKVIVLVRVAVSLRDSSSRCSSHGVYFGSITTSGFGIVLGAYY